MTRQVRFALIYLFLGVFAVALAGKSAYEQVWQHKKWEAAAVKKHVVESTLPAPRGEIRDSRGRVLAQSRDMVTLEVAPRELTAPDSLAKVLRRVGVPASTTRRFKSKGTRWVTVPGRFAASAVLPALSMRGVHPRMSAERLVANSEGLRRVLGTTNVQGKGVEGIELLLDSLLQGERGQTAVLRSRWSRMESPEALTRQARPGHTIVLTINQELQEIADGALDDAMRRLGASGGDIVVLDVRNADIMAMSSRRPGASAPVAVALTETYEPGSTLKPFFAARLLERKLARADEMIATYDGTYTLNGRTITDIHKAAEMSLAEVIRESSNIGIVRFSQRMGKGDIYELLRDIGLGTPTGVSYPSEVAGRLTEPKRWSNYTSGSLPMGYEVAVTPLQLAAAYVALGNGGELLAPSLVKEIRNADGTVIFQRSRKLVRRVFDADASGAVLKMLESVVDSGTGKDATLATFGFAGKSGTSRRVVKGRYVPGRYNASFVGLFPARAPQFVVLVRLDVSGSVFYGGKAAAPVAKAVVQGALAARDPGFDRGSIASQRAEYVPPPLVIDSSIKVVASSGNGDSELAMLEPDTGRTDDSTRRSAMPQAPPPLPEAPMRRSVEVDLSAPNGEVVPLPRLVPVPDVRGFSLRVAVHTLHRAGFRVLVVTGTDGATLPTAGSAAPTGSLVRLYRR